MNTNIKSNSFLIEIILIGTLFVDLFTKVIPIEQFTIAIFIFQFFRVDFNSNIILSLMIIPQVAGSILNNFGVSGMGSYIIAFGLILIFLGIILHKTELKISAKSKTLMALLISFLVISVLFSSGGDYAISKLIKTSIRAFITFTVFIVLFSNFENIDKQKLGIFMLLYAFVLLRLGITINQIPGPSSILDFGFLRNQTVEILSYSNNSYQISYHYPGYIFLQGFAIFLMSRSYSLKKILFFLLLGGLITLFSGARQTVIILFIFTITLVLMRINKKLQTLLLIGSIILFAIYLLEATSIGILFSSTISEGYIEGSSRGPFLMRGIELFSSNPIMGVGFGRYSIFGIYNSYPHNIFIEILCELGIAGLIFFLTLTIYAFKGTRDFINIYIYFLLVIFLASLASYSLENNIIIFSFIFSLPSIAGNKI